MRYLIFKILNIFVIASIIYADLSGDSVALLAFLTCFAIGVLINATIHTVIVHQAFGNSYYPYHRPWHPTTDILRTIKSLFILALVSVICIFLFQENPFVFKAASGTLGIILLLMPYLLFAQGTEDGCKWIEEERGRL